MSLRHQSQKYLSVCSILGGKLWKARVRLFSLWGFHGELTSARCLIYLQAAGCEPAGRHQKANWTTPVIYSRIMSAMSLQQNIQCAGTLHSSRIAKCPEWHSIKLVCYAQFVTCIFYKFTCHILLGLASTIIYTPYTTVHLVTSLSKTPYRCTRYQRWFIRRIHMMPYRIKTYRI
jgi:hypothetical protein